MEDAGLHELFTLVQLEPRASLFLSQRSNYKPMCVQTYDVNKAPGKQSCVFNALHSRKYQIKKRKEKQMKIN